MLDVSVNAELVEAIATGVVASLARSERTEQPFPTWWLSPVFPKQVARDLAALPFTPGAIGGESGARELHNDTRHYFAGDVLNRRPVASAVADAFQSPRVVAALAEFTGARLDGTFLRIEYATDTDGFWLKPHTDLGVKALTLLIQLARRGQAPLGTDIYDDPEHWRRRVPFLWNAALMFVPSDCTWHGFEPRTIKGVRRSVIVNYVTDAWRAREQLAFPTRPVSL